MRQDPKNIAAAAIAASAKTLSRRQLFDRSIGIGAFLLTAGAAKAVDPMHGNMDVSPTMDMSTPICTAPDSSVAAMDQPAVRQRRAQHDFACRLRLPSDRRRKALCPVL
jgi:hypothetical protein